MNIGIIGDGQLGRMLALSGYPLGFNFGFLGNKNSPSGNLGEVFDNIADLDKFADVITYESESTDLDLVKNLTTPVYPPINALKITQNRTLEKALFSKLNIDCAPNISINSLQELTLAVEKIKTPCIVKTTTDGYDGKGQFIIKKQDDIKQAWNEIKSDNLIVEGFIDFDFEVSIIAVFSQNEVKYYPLTKNTHKDGILDVSLVIDDDILFKKAQKIIDKIAQEFDYIGVLTVEFFVKNGELIANEIAPRVHNSGHWSIDCAKTSQFENHIRAITNSPLGATTPIYTEIKMQNIISKLPNITEILEDENSFLHLYDKSERQNRKLGHINFTKNYD